MEEIRPDVDDDIRLAVAHRDRRLEVLVDRSALVQSLEPAPMGLVLVVHCHLPYWFTALSRHLELLASNELANQSTQINSGGPATSNASGRRWIDRENRSLRPSIR
jgi:hypothetical protein